MRVCIVVVVLRTVLEDYTITTTIDANFQRLENLQPQVSRSQKKVGTPEREQEATSCSIYALTRRKQSPE